VILLKNKIIGLAVAGTILTTGMVGCRQTALDNAGNNTRRNMQRVEYEIKNPNSTTRNTRLGTQPYYGDRTIRDNDTRPFNDRNIGFNNQEQNGNTKIGTNNNGTRNNSINETNFGMNNNQRIGYKDTGLFVTGNTIVIPSRITRNDNDATYVDITQYINQVTPFQKTNQIGTNSSRAINDNNNTATNTAPMYTLTLPNSVSFIRYNENNPNVIYVRDVAKQNTDKAITLNNNEKLLVAEGKTYMPLSTLRKILAVKTATNPSTMNCEVRS
jgi:hypothetical protein